MTVDTRTTTPTQPPHPAAHPAGDRGDVDRAGKRHAAPISAFDTLEVPEPGTAVAVKKIVAEDDYLAGHYPHFTIYPGVFTVETVQQAARAALAADGIDAGLTDVTSVRFTGTLVPGDTLTTTLTIGAPADDGSVEVKARCHRQDGGSCARITLRLRTREDAATAMTVETPDATRHTRQTLEHADLKRILAHRHPILQLDRAVEFVPGRRIVAIKAVTGSEPCYGGLGDDATHADHAYPASLLMESMGQASAALWLHSAGLAGDDPRGTLVFGSARGFTIAGDAYPGDVLRHVVELDGTKGDNAFLHGETWVGDRRIVTADSMLVALRDDRALT